MSKIDLPREKKVGHLTLHRPTRTLTPKEYNALAPRERLAMISAAEGRRKFDLILEAQDAERLVRQLPAQEIYLLLKELGKEDVPELLQFSSTEQITTFLDLDCWDGDVFDGGRVAEWLELLLESGEEKVWQSAQEFDFGLLVLILKKLVVVTHGPEDYLDDDARQEAVQRHGGYEIEFTDSEGAKVTAAFLDVVFRRDLDFYVRMLEAVRWEQESLLEEDELRLRSGRLQDHGFPDPFEALSVYAWLDPGDFEPSLWRKRGIVAGEATEAPGFVLTAATPKGILAEILSGGLDSETCWELTFLLNQVMAADRVDVGEMARVREEMGEVYRYLNLALEHLAGSDLDKAEGFFSGLYLQALFRLGYSLTLQLQKRARDLAKSPVGPYLDGPFRALVDALGHRKPRFYEGMEDVTRAGERPFAELKDLRLASEWLDRIEVQRRLFTGILPFELPAPADVDLSGCTPDDPADLALSDFFLTALANRLLGRSFLPRPLTTEDIFNLHQKISTPEGTLVPELRKETANWLDILLPGAGAFGEGCLDIWAEEFCALPAEELDARYVSGLIVRQ